MQTAAVLWCSAMIIVVFGCTLFGFIKEEKKGEK